MKTYKKIKTMKSKSIIGAALAAIFTLGVTTSCEDMFDIDSSRVIIEKDHTLSNSADSVYSTLGVLQSMRKILDRYIILGEVRGDLVDINNHTKTSLRNLAEFNFEEDNEYLNIKDYYAVINNCNYVLAKMDTTLAHNNERVMTDEYAALLGIRAWTYLQLGINYGKVRYFTNPITTVADSEKEYPELDMKGLAAEIIPQLVPYIDYELPAWDGDGIPQTTFPPLQLVLGDYYLWSGDYANAWATYWDYMTTHPDFNYQYGPEGQEEIFKGYMGLNGSQYYSIEIGNTFYTKRHFWDSYLERGVGTEPTENLTQIYMDESSANGVVSEIANLFISLDNTHPLNTSTYWDELNAKQVFIRATVDNKTGEETGSYTPNTLAGDQRKKFYTESSSSYTTNGVEEFPLYIKHSVFNVSNNEISRLYTSAITIYRRAIVYLRAAEALNALAKEQWDLANGTDTLLMAEARGNATKAFYLMKDAYPVFFPEGHVLEKELRQSFLGVHARGCGDIRLDTMYYVLKKEAVALKLYNNKEQAVNFTDTINYIDELIIDELALEASLEGNRFGDLMRFSDRRYKQGLDEVDGDFLAKRVASRKGSEQMDEELYNKLLDKSLWYLPIK